MESTVVHVHTFRGDSEDLAFEAHLDTVLISISMIADEQWVLCQLTARYWQLCYRVPVQDLVADALY